MADATDVDKAKADAEAKEAQELLEKIKAKGLKLYSDEEMKESIRRRDEALKKLDKFEAEEKKSKEAKLLEEKKYEELVKTKSSELEREQLEKKSLAEKVKAYEEREQKERDELLATIKDDKDKEIASALPSVDLVRKFVEKIESQTGGPSTARGVKTATQDASPFKALEGESYTEYQRRLGKLKQERGR